MTEINKKHDTFFRETMSHKDAADFLVNYLPAKVLKHVRLDMLAAIPAKNKNQIITNGYRFPEK
ncbi:Rpn family recombination-promoting nuclease/putative transposase [Desulfonatronum parangueonense]